MLEETQVRGYCLTEQSFEFWRRFLIPSGHCGHLLLVELLILWRKNKGINIFWLHYCYYTYVWISSSTNDLVSASKEGLTRALEYYVLEMFLSSVSFKYFFLQLMRIVWLTHEMNDKNGQYDSFVTLVLFLMCRNLCNLHLSLFLFYLNRMLYNSLVFISIYFFLIIIIFF